VRTQREAEVADIARGPGVGLDARRETVSPLLPGLYSFISRRAHDAEDAEDLLVEVLQEAFRRAHLYRGPRLSLEGWLLRLANNALKSDLERSPVLRSGFAAPMMRAPAGVRDSVAALPADQRDALGMRLVDGLPHSLIGEALGKDGAVAAALAERAFDRVCDEQGAQGRAVLEAILPIPSPYAFTPSLEARVWERFEEAGDSSSSGGGLPIYVPPWAGRAALALVVLLAGLWGWRALDNRPDGRPQAPALLQAAVVPTAAPAPALTVLPVPKEIGSPRVERPLGAGASPTGTPVPVASSESLPGTLLYLEHDARAERGALTLVLASPGGGRDVSRIEQGSAGSFVYSVSPTGVRLAYARRGQVFVRTLDGLQPERHLFTLESPKSDFWRYEMDRTPNRFKAGALAWNDDDKTLAVASEPLYYKGLEVNRVFIVNALTGEVNALATLRGDEDVRSLSWRPGGDELLVTTAKNVSTLTFARGAAVQCEAAEAKCVTRTVLPGVVRAYWSPVRADERLLWVGRRAPGDASGRRGTREFGLSAADGSRRVVLGDAMHARWRQDGKSLLVTSAARGGTGVEHNFYQVPIGGGPWRRLGPMPAALAEADDVQLSRDGVRLVYTVNGVMYLADADTGEVVRLTLSENGQVSASAPMWYEPTVRTQARLWHGDGQPGSGTPIKVDWTRCHESPPPLCP